MPSPRHAEPVAITVLRVVRKEPLQPAISGVIGVAVLVIWADRRFKLGHGRAFALYVASYCVGRFWVEYMRVDDAHHILGLRLNNWTALIVFLLAVAYIVISAKKRPGREAVVEPGANPSTGEAEDDADADSDAEAKDEDAKGKAEEDVKEDVEEDVKDEAGSGTKKT